MSDSVVSVERDGEIGLIVLNHPPVNAFNRALISGIADACEELGADDSVGAVVFLAEGEKAFSAGADISGLPDAPPTSEQLRHNLEQECAAFDKVVELPQPSIAAVFGHTLGGGLELALGCDFRIASDDLQVGLPEAKLGYFPASGSLVRMAHTVGLSNAKRLAIIGDSIGAEEARSIGLVDEIVARDALRDRTIEFARELAAPDATSVRAIKRILNADAERHHADDVGLILDIAAPVA